MERKKKSLTLLQNPQKGVDNKRNEKTSNFSLQNVTTKNKINTE